MAMRQRGGQTARAARAAARSTNGRAAGRGEVPAPPAGDEEQGQQGRERSRSPPRRSIAAAAAQVADRPAVGISEDRLKAILGDYLGDKVSKPQGSEPTHDAGLAVGYLAVSDMLDATSQEDKGECSGLLNHF